MARLFANTPYGTSVWARFPCERYACLRPLNRVADWLTGQGLAISAGTLADGARRLAPLFEPLSAAILARENEARLRQGDETAWRIRALGEAGGSSRAWLWIGVCEDAVRFHVDPSRSAAAAARLFGDAAPGTVLVCDRYSAYKKLGRELGDRLTLAFCWVHARRDFIKCAAGNETPAEWERCWTGRIARLYRLNGARLEQHVARVTMLAMHKDGLITLPPPKWRQNRPGPIIFGPDTEPPLLPAPTTLDEVRPLDPRPVVRGTRAGKLWNEFVVRHHYLGHTTLVGAQMRYAVHDRDGTPLAMLGFSTAAWRLAPRDNFIGWTPQLREKNLPLVVDNPRFLIPPWIEIPNLGSHLLAIVRRRLPEDWAVRYNTKPVLIETFVETPRFTGAVYRASGWIHVGTTRGRGRYDRQRQFDKPRKDIWLRPLGKDWKRILNR